MERSNRATQIAVCVIAVLLAYACGDSLPDQSSPLGEKPGKAEKDRNRGDDDGDGDNDAEDESEGDGDKDGKASNDDPDSSVGDGDDEITDAGGTSYPLPDGLPEGAAKIAGIEFFQRIIGKWTGINSDTPIGFDFPMTVDIDVSDDGLLFGKYEIDASNNVLWGFNIETYDGKDVLAYRNGGYLFGLKRDSRAQLVEHDSARGFYRFCAVLEHGFPVKGCDYIDATYTFSAPDKMLFEVKTRSGEPHVHWEARRTQTHALPNPFPATVKSQGNGSAAWPAAAGIK